MKRIIDNKKIDLTDDEWKLYQKICTSYDRPNFLGKDLFKGLFETDDNGKIIFLIPPTSRYSSMEVYMFLAGIMIHQHLGSACDSVDNLYKQMQEKIFEVDNFLKRGENILEQLKNIEKPQIIDIATHEK